MSDLPSKSNAVHHEMIQTEDITRYNLGHVDRADDTQEVAVDVRAVGGDVENMPAGYFYKPAFLGTVVAACFSGICGYLGWVLPANTLVLIDEDIGPSNNLGWVALIWILGFSLGFTLIGRLSDIFGRRWFIMGSSLLGIIGCIIGGTAKSIDILIIANLFNGLAAAGQLSFAVVIGELVPNKLRGPFNAIVLASSAPFAVFGPVIARAFILHTAAGWRWSYYLGIIFGGLSVMLYFFFYFPPSFGLLHIDGKTKLQQLKTLDYGGIVLFTAGFTLFLIGLSWGGSTYPWKSGQVIGTIVGGVVVFIALGLWENFVTKHPLIPPKMFKNIHFVAITGCASFAAMNYYAGTVVWPTMAGSLWTTNVMQIGWESCLIGGGLLAGQLSAGLGVRYIPRMKYQMIFISCALCGFTASLSTANAHSHTRSVILGFFALFTAGYVENLTLSTVGYVWAPEDMGLALGVLGSVRSAAGALATAIYVSIETNQFTKGLTTIVAPAVVKAGLPATSLTALFEALATGNFSEVPSITPAIEGVLGDAVKTAYAEAFKLVFLVSIVFSGLCIICACFVPNVEEYLTDHVARRLNKHEDAMVAEKTEQV